MKYCTLLIFVSLSVFSLAREKSVIDSLKALAANEKNDSLKAGIFNNLSEQFSVLDFNNALQYSDSARQISQKLGLETETGKSFNLSGIAHYYRGEYEKALFYYLGALRVFERTDDKRNVVITLNHIGNLHRKQGDPGQSLEKLLLAKKICLGTVFKRELAICFDNLGVTYEALGQPDSALNYYQESLTIDRELNFPEDIPYSLNYAAGIYAEKGDFKKALSFYEEALSIRKTLNDKAGLAIILTNTGELFLKQKELDKSIEYFEKALTLSLEINFIDLNKFLYQILAEVNGKQNNFQKAYHFQLLSDQLNDSLFSEQKSRLITEMQTKYETEKKEKEIEIQDLKIQDQQMKLSQRNIFIIILFLGLIMIIALAILIFRQEKLRQKQVRDKAIIEQQELRLRAIIEGEEKERRRLAQELHDGLGQLLSTVKINISGLDGNIPDQREKHLSTSLELIDEACIELRNISHNLMPGALIKLGLVPALKEFTDKINQSGTLSIHLQTHGIQNRLDASIETGLYRIIQELLNNIIKYAKAKKVTIQLIKDENQLTAMIEDDGTGFDIKIIEKSDGIGWNNIKSRVQFLHGNFDIDSHPNRGTTVTIELQV